MQTQSTLSVQSQVTTALNYSVTVSARALSQNLLYAQDSVVQLGRGSKEGKKKTQSFSILEWLLYRTAHGCPKIPVPN